MKRIYFLLVFFGALLFCACDKDNSDLLMEDPAQTQLEDGALKGAKKHAVPFRGTFVQSQTWDDFSNFPSTFPKGKETLNVVPISFWLTTSTFPFNDSTCFLTIDNPKPTPLFFVE